MYVLLTCSPGEAPAWSHFSLTVSIYHFWYLLQCTACKLGAFSADKPLHIAAVSTQLPVHWSVTSNYHNHAALYIQLRLTDSRVLCSEKKIGAKLLILNRKTAINVHWKNIKNQDPVVRKTLVLDGRQVFDNFLAKMTHILSELYIVSLIFMRRVSCPLNFYSTGIILLYDA